MYSLEFFILINWYQNFGVSGCQIKNHFFNNSIAVSTTRQQALLESWPFCNHCKHSKNCSNLSLIVIFCLKPDKLENFPSLFNSELGIAVEILSFRWFSEGKIETLRLGSG